MTLVTSWPQFVPRAQPLIKSLAERALGNKSSQDGEWLFGFRNVLLYNSAQQPPVVLSLAVAGSGAQDMLCLAPAEVNSDFLASPPFFLWGACAPGVYLPSVYTRKNSPC